MKRKRESKVSETICMISSMILSICVSVLALLISAKFGLASRDSIVNAVEKVDYYSKAYDDFMDECESILIPSGLDIQVMDGVFQKEEMETDGKKYLQGELNGSTFNVDISKYTEKLEENIHKYVEEKSLSSDGDTDEIITEISAEITSYYLKSLKVPYAYNLGIVCKMFDNHFLLVFVAFIIFAVALIWVIYMQNPYKRNRIFRFIAYSTMSGAISTLVIPIYCYVTNFYKKIQIYPEYFYRFVITYIEHTINVMLVIGIILIIISIIMIVMSTYIKHIYMKEKKERDMERAIRHKANEEQS